MIFLGEDDVRGLLRMEELIPAMVSALRDLSMGKVNQPMRLVLPVAEHKGFFAVMPAYGGALGAKLVTFYPNNKGVPTHHAMILLFRPETGEPLVTMDGRLITEMRTAAVSAVATDALARADASVLAILGSGCAGAESSGSAPDREKISRGASLEPAELEGVLPAARCLGSRFGGGSGARR